MDKTPNYQFVHIGLSQRWSRSKTTKMLLSAAITLISLTPAWASPPSQFYDQDSVPQLDQLSLSSSDLPIILNLAQTFSKASLGVQGDAFQKWVDEPPLDASMLTLRTLVL